MTNKPPAERLKDALAALITTASVNDSPVTVAALCRLADVSRNSLYRYHPEVLQALREHQQQRRSRPARACSTGHPQQAELVALRLQVPKLVALVDHYYAAYCETRDILGRRDQELAELRRRLDAKPVRLTR